MASTDGVGGGMERSLVGWLAPKRAASRTALFNSCLRLKAPPKSKIPTTRTTSNGRETANSIMAAASVPRSRDPNLHWANMRSVFSRHLHSRVKHNFLHIERSERQVEL